MYLETHSSKHQEVMTKVRAVRERETTCPQGVLPN